MFESLNLYLDDCQEMKVAKKFSGRTFNIIYPIFGFIKYSYYISEIYIYIYMANMNLKLVRLIVPACLLLSFVWVYGSCTMLEQVVFGKARSLCSQDQTHMWSLFFRSYITPEAVRSREYVPTTLGLNLCITPLSGGISFPIFLPSSTCFLNSLLSRPVQDVLFSVLCLH